MIPIALFSDAHMLPGLHVTLLSLLNSLNSNRGNQIELYIFLDNVRSKEKDWLAETHAKGTKGARLFLRDYSPTAPTGGGSLHGNTTTYGRLSLPDLLPEFDRCIYLDCDLIVNRCVCDLFDHFDGQNVLLVDGTGIRKTSLDRELFKKANLDLEGSCFNSGVMGIDLELWRDKDFSSLCADISRKYSGMFKAADQALLNTALHSSFKSVGDAFNSALYPTSPKVNELEERIYHFVGSPKPWDFLGSITSNHYAMWRTIYERTAIATRWPLLYSSLKRTVRIARQSLKALKK